MCIADYYGMDKAALVDIIVEQVEVIGTLTSKNSSLQNRLNHAYTKLQGDSDVHRNDSVGEECS